MTPYIVVTEIGNFLVLPYFLFLHFVVRWRWAIPGSLRHYRSARVCRVMIFPGWAWPPVAAAGDVIWLLHPPDEWKPGHVVEPILVLAMAACFVAYTRSARRFLDGDDWWSGLGKRFRKRAAAFLAGRRTIGATQ